MDYYLLKISEKGFDLVNAVTDRVERTPIPYSLAGEGYGWFPASKPIEEACAELQDLAIEAAEKEIARIRAKQAKFASLRCDLPQPFGAQK